MPAEPCLDAAQTGAEIATIAEHATAVKDGAWTRDAHGSAQPGPRPAPLKTVAMMRIHRYHRA